MHGYENNAIGSTLGQKFAVPCEPGTISGRLDNIEKSLYPILSGITRAADAMYGARPEAVTGAVPTGHSLIAKLDQIASVINALEEQTARLENI